MEERLGRGVRMSDIAEAAGVSRQAVYDHFGSRAELMAATVRYGDVVLGLDERLRRYRAATGGAEAAWDDRMATVREGCRNVI